MNNNIAFIKSTFPAFAGRQACSLFLVNFPD